MFGLDYVTGPPIADLKAAGVTFVCRYTGYTSPSLPQTKILTLAEAKELSAAGIALVSNWEWYANRAVESFASGAWDAQEAQKIHASCGGPADRPIYFSVDADVAGDQCVEYFKGVASVIGLHRTGAYGSYRVLQYLFNANLITWGWQTYAWSYGAWEPRAHIQQYQNGVTLAGLSVDYDRSIKSDFGQWRIGGINMGVPTGWHDDGTTLTAPNGHKVVKGFREWVLSHNWEAGNWPLEDERGTPQLEDSNPGLGGGSQQIFRWAMLGYTTSRGVFEEWLGQELFVCRQQVAKYYPLAKEVPDLQTQIQQYQSSLQAAQATIKTLQEQLAQAQAQATGIDPTKVKDFQTALGLQAHGLVTSAQALETAIIAPIS